MFPNYDNFHNPDIAYNDFINGLDCVVNAIVPFMTVRVKKNTNEWFDGEIVDKIHTRGKLYKRFKLTNYMLIKKSISTKRSPKFNSKKEKSILWGKTKRKHKKSEKS